LIHLPSLVRQRERLFLQDVINVLQVSVPIEAQKWRKLWQVVAEQHHQQERSHHHGHKRWVFQPFRLPSQTRTGARKRCKQYNRQQNRPVFT
jgi:hypothetical protein